jgi:hypothetical protein
MLAESQLGPEFVPSRSTPAGSAVRVWALRTLIVSIVISAIAAVVALLSPEFGEVQEKTLGTAFVFSAASLNTMACATAWDARRRVAYAPAWGIVLSYSVFALLAGSIWLEIDSTSYARTVATLAVMGILAAHASLLRRAPLTPRAEATGWAAIASAAILAGFILLQMWLWRDEAPGDVMLRLWGLAGVITAAATIATPIVHLLSRGHEGQARTAMPAASRAFCPRCGSSVGEGTEWADCPACGARFQVRFR